MSPEGLLPHVQDNSLTGQQTYNSTDHPHSRPQTISPIDKRIITKRMYFSHALYVWNSRVYEFGIILFVINLYPGTLIPGSLLSIVGALSSIVLSTTVTRLVNSTPRLQAIKSTIFIQRTFAMISASFLLIVFAKFQNHTQLKAFCLVVVIVCAAVERLCTIANKISISRDWLVKITVNDNSFLLEMNTQMRAIDLFCKLSGPLFISTFLSLTNHEITACFLVLAFMISAPLEYDAIMHIYRLVPQLQVKFQSQESEISAEDQTPKSLLEQLSYWESLKLFAKNPLAAAVLAMSLTYFTVLSFGNSTIAYLLSYDDIGDFKIGLLRGVSSCFELFGTMVIFPYLSSKLGLVNTGLFAVTFQFLSLLPIGLAFALQYDKTHWLMCYFIPMSRIGLWCFDLAIANSIQIFINDELQRFNATSFEESLNNLFELLGYITTLVFNKPEQFEWPACLSVFSIGLSMILYMKFVIGAGRSLTE